MRFSQPWLLEEGDDATDGPYKVKQKTLWDGGIYGLLKAFMDHLGLQLLWLMSLTNLVLFSVQEE